MTKQLARLAAAAVAAVGTPGEDAAQDAYDTAVADDAEVRIIQASYNCTRAQARGILGK